MTQEQIEELRRLEALASPAPWASVGHELYFSHQSHQQIRKAEDAHLIAAMRNLLKELLGEVDRLREELAHHHCDSCDGSAPSCWSDKHDTLPGEANQ